MTHRTGIHRRTAAAAAALLALALLPCGLAPAAAEETEVTWGVRTADGVDGPRDNYVFEIEPGASIRDAIVIANYDDAALALDVYAADGFTTEAGQLGVAARDAVPTGIGAWTLPTADRVVVEPGTAVEVPFEVSVPANAEPGDYAGGLLTSLATPEAGDGVAIDRRLGIRIHLRVGGELAPALAIEGLHVDYTGTPNPFGTGTANVSFDVVNAGNARLAAGQQVRLAGPFGMLPVAAVELPDVPELLPGETWHVETTLAGVFPALLLTAEASLAPVAPEGSDAAASPVASTASAWAVPWTLLALVLLAAAGIVLAVVRGRRARVRRRADEDARVQAAVDAAL
ncbi:DUF916 domain-containing protein, partial [Agromyces seonyuensis]